MLKLLVAATMLLALVTNASASLIPPARYDRPYAGRLIVVALPLAQLRQSCGDPYCWAWTYGDMGGTCTIYLPQVDGKRITRKFYNLLYRHERAHCHAVNPWPAHHPR
jgi:hypothetical protein